MICRFPTDQKYKMIKLLWESALKQEVIYEHQGVAVLKYYNKQITVFAGIDIFLVW